MAQTSTKRRSHGDDAIYFAADKNRYVGAISLGFGPDGRRLRKKVTGGRTGEWSTSAFQAASWWRARCRWTIVLERTSA